jgi:hypothetical protein
VLNRFGEEIETISKQRPAVGHSLHNATRKTTFSKQRQISLPERVGTPWPTPHQSSVPPTPSPFPSQTPASTSACNASDPRSLEQSKCPNRQGRAIMWSGRVRKWRCRHSLPSEPDVRLSPHPAQAAPKPRVSGAGVTRCATFTIRACSLLAWYSHWGQVNLSRCVALPEDAHMDKSTFICFSSYEGSTGSLVTNDLSGSRPACAAE